MQPDAPPACAWEDELPNEANLRRYYNLATVGRENPAKGDSFHALALRFTTSANTLSNGFNLFAEKCKRRTRRYRSRRLASRRSRTEQPSSKHVPPTINGKTSDKGSSISD